MPCDFLQCIMLAFEAFALMYEVKRLPKQFMGFYHVQI